METLLFLLVLFGGGYLWLAGKDRFYEFRTKRLLAKLALKRRSDFDEFWASSSQSFSKEVASFMYSLIRELLQELDFHPDFPLHPEDHLLKILGNNEYYTEHIFDITVEEFASDDFDFDDDYFVFPKMVEKTVDELMTLTDSYIQNIQNHKERPR